MAPSRLRYRCALQALMLPSQTPNHNTTALSALLEVIVMAQKAL